jgi:Tfp pilus assembly protein PilF
MKAKELAGKYRVRRAWTHRWYDGVAVTEFTRALELDPTYAPAHAALANCYNQLGTVLGRMPGTT